MTMGPKERAWSRFTFTNTGAGDPAAK